MWISGKKEEESSRQAVKIPNIRVFILVD